MNTDPAALSLARKCADAMLERDTAIKTLDISVTDIAPGQAVLQMPVTDAMLNGHETCHGGFIFTLADSAFAFACNTYDEVTVAASADISFVAPARKGDVLTASAAETWREGRNGVYDITVENNQGITIALFRGKSRTVQGSVINPNSGKDQ